MKKDQQAKPKPNVSKPKPRSAEKSFLSRIPWLAALLLAVGIAYGPVLNKEFINYDDDLYIVKNPNVMNFGPGNIGHVFSSFYEEQYSPLATVATGIIYRISGEKPFLYNLVALLIHLANTLLVFWLVRLLLENFYPALLAAAIFGLHAANVEAIAWAAAVFKIGLYAMFFLLSVIAYVHYVRKAEMKFLFLSLAAFLLSCFSKEQAAALPATIVLIDYFYGRKLLSGKVIAEKVPFALISLTFAFVSIASTALNRAGIEATPFSMADKITYSAQALTHYLTTMVLPVGLYLNYAILSIKDMGFVFYLNLVTFLLVATALVYFLVKKMKVPFFALAFFMANILFALLLAVVSVRETITADRYVYISSIAYGLIMGYLAHWVYSRKMSNLPAVAGIGAAYILMLGFMANSYASTWKNSFTVMDRIVNHEPVQFALVNRGLWYKQHDEVEKAMEDFNRAIRIYPDKHMAYLNRGNIYFNKGKDSLAELDYNMVMKLDTGDAEIFANLGAIYTRSGRYDAALKMFDHAIRKNPSLDNSYLNKAITLKYMKRYDEAITAFREYLKFQPKHDGVYDEIGRILQEQGKLQESADAFSQAIRLAPGYAQFYQDRAVTYYNMKDYMRAKEDMDAAKRLGGNINPQFEAALQMRLKEIK